MTADAEERQRMTSGQECYEVTSVTSEDTYLRVRVATSAFVAAGKCVSASLKPLKVK